MTVKNTDPLQGVALVGAKPPQTKKAEVAAGTVVSLSAAKSARKRAKLTGKEFIAARDFARKTTGYNDSSPIWGKKLIDVLVDIEGNLMGAQADLSAGDSASANIALEAALEYNRELQKRLATNALIAAQSH